MKRAIFLFLVVPLCVSYSGASAYKRRVPHGNNAPDEIHKEQGDGKFEKPEHGILLNNKRAVDLDSVVDNDEKIKAKPVHQNVRADEDDYESEEEGVGDEEIGGKGDNVLEDEGTHPDENEREALNNKATSKEVSYGKGEIESADDNDDEGEDYGGGKGEGNNDDNGNVEIEDEFDDEGEEGGEGEGRSKGEGENEGGVGRDNDGDDEGKGKYEGGSDEEGEDDENGKGGDEVQEVDEGEGENEDEDLQGDEEKGISEEEVQDADDEDVDADVEAEGVGEDEGENESEGEKVGEAEDEVEEEKGRKHNRPGDRKRVGNIEREGKGRHVDTAERKDESEQEGIPDAKKKRLRKGKEDKERRGDNAKEEVESGSESGCLGKCKTNNGKEYVNKAKGWYGFPVDTRGEEIGVIWIYRTNCNVGTGICESKFPFKGAVKWPWMESWLENGRNRIKGIGNGWKRDEDWLNKVGRKWAQKGVSKTQS